MEQGLFGNYYEDFEPGRVFKHYPGRTVTQTDNIWFTLLTMNTHPLHFNTDYCAKTEFGRPLVNSTLTLAIITGMSVRDISQNAIANLGFDEVRIPAPTFEGDTLYAETEVLARRESKSRPTCGIVTVLTTGKNQNNEIIMTFKRNILVKKRDHDREQQR
ncbi:MAG: MaoC family dehydratase [bacterium]|jgi:itaconyl-CoA hydratase